MGQGSEATGYREEGGGWGLIDDRIGDARSEMTASWKPSGLSWRVRTTKEGAVEKKVSLWKCKGREKAWEPRLRKRNSPVKKVVRKFR